MATPKVSGSAGPDQRSDPDHLPALDGLRVVAMFGILVVHAEFSSRANTSGIVADLAVRTDVGVAIFFVLSAFLLFRPMVVALLRNDTPAPLVAYAARRLVRIFPGYWAVLAVLVAIDVVDLSSWREIVLAATLTFPLFDPPFTDSNFLGLGQTWAIVLLLQSYLLMPIIAALFRRLVPSGEPIDRARQLLGWCAALTVAGLAFRSIISFGTPSWELRAVAWLPMWLDVLGPGLALAVIAGARSLGLALDYGLDALQRRPWIGWLTAAAIYLLFAIVDAPNQPADIGPEYSFRNLAFSAIAVTVVASAAVANPTEDLVARALASGPMRGLSRFSLGFFVGHLAIMGKVESWLGYEPFQSQLVPLIAVTTPLALVLAMATWYAVERPAANALARLTRPNLME